MNKLLLNLRCHLSNHSNILLMDALPCDMPDNIEKWVLKGQVSKRLQIPYLSKYQHSIDQLEQPLTRYRGIIVGYYNRVFFTIPTARKDSVDYYNVHYLFDPFEEISTLTYQTLCCLYGLDHQKEGVKFTDGVEYCKIGRKDKQLMIKLSDHDIMNVQKYKPHKKQSEISVKFSNANVLGMNFLKMYKITRHELYFGKEEASLELIL